MLVFIFSSPLGIEYFKILTVLYQLLCRKRRKDSRSSSNQRCSSAAKSSKVLTSADLVKDSDSLTLSEADTLTGIHLDNSSQYGVPPVFNPLGIYYILSICYF